jgi:hypothetical protein
LGIFDFYQQVADMPSRLGRHIANHNLSDESIALADRYGELKDAARGDNLSSCAVKTAGRAFSSEIPDCKLGAGEITRQVGERAITAGLTSGIEKAIGGATGVGLGVGLLKDGVISGFEANSNHHGMVELMSKNDVPGFSYKEIEVGTGIKYKVWVDATAEALKQDGKVNVNAELDMVGVDPTEGQRMIDRDDRERMKAMQEAATNEALGSMHDYIRENGVEGYRQNLTEIRAYKMHDYLVPETSEKELSTGTPFVADEIVPAQPEPAVP